MSLYFREEFLHNQDPKLSLREGTGKSYPPTNGQPPSLSGRKASAAGMVARRL